MIKVKSYKEYLNVSVLNLVLIFITIFICPLLPASTLPYIFPFCFSGIFLLVSLSMERNRRFNLYSSALIISIIWIGILTRNDTVRSISRVLQFLFFIYLLLLKVALIAGTSSVKRQAIIDSITAYFLLGLAFTSIVLFTASLIPGSYNVQVDMVLDKFEPQKDYFYYTFVTYTTTGYGDIVPLKPESRSLAVLIAVSGQLYIAIIIAMLVGKYSQQAIKT